MATQLFNLSFNLPSEVIKAAFPNPEGNTSTSKKALFVLLIPAKGDLTSVSLITLF